MLSSYHELKNRSIQFLLLTYFGCDAKLNLRKDKIRVESIRSARGRGKMPSLRDMLTISIFATTK